MSSRGSTSRRPRLGILGGLGPHAHVAFECHLLARCATEREQDYPDWVVWSCPSIPDRTAALLGRGPSPAPALRAALRRLAALADLAVVPCNTAHAFLPGLPGGPETAPLPLISLIHETIQALPETGAVGLLATTGTLESAIYQSTAPERRWLTLLDLHDGRDLQRRLVMDAIYGPQDSNGQRHGGIKGGGWRNPLTGQAHAEALAEAAARLFDAGAEIVVTGCTEIPLALPWGPWLVDPMWVSAGAALERLGCPLRDPRSTYRPSASAPSL